MPPYPFQFWPALKREDNNQTAIYFAHANAYPPASYLGIIEGLRQHAPVISYLQRPLWPRPPELSSVETWRDFADDVVAFFNQEKISEVVAVGHSMGAVSAFLANCKKPGLLKALVMIEPVLFSRWFCWLNRMLPQLVRRRVPIIKKTLNRPDEWSSVQEAFDFHRRTRAFKRVSDEHLWKFIQAGVKADEDGIYHLAFDKYWEAHIYETVTPIRRQLLQSQLPLLGLRGEFTDTVPESFWSQWKKNKHHQLVEIPDSGHLLPLERPDEVLAQVTPFIEQHLSP